MKTNKNTNLQEILGKQITRQEALALLKSSPEAYEKFLTFPPEFQEQILEFLQGIRGLPILYDSFFKKILDPYRAPERLERFLSSLLKQKIRIVGILTREGTQLVEKGSLVIMDILVETEDGSLINIEMQKHGYDFTGERSACYMSDLIMRQYTRVRSERKDKFSFKDIKSVYLIVIMENSSKNFKKVAPQYLHRSQYSMDTGAEMNFLTNYIYISLDTFHSIRQNIDSYLDAWLTFLSSDTPSDILRLIASYPEFKTYYHEIALFRKKPKELMHMYSEALLELDRNTVDYMIEEMKKENEQLAASIAEKKQLLTKQNHLIAEKDNTIAEKDNTIAEKDNTIAEKDNTIAEKDNTIAEKDAYIRELELKLAKLNNV